MATYSSQFLIEQGLNPDFITKEFLISQNLSWTLPWRFLKKVVKTESCWLWKGGKIPSGTGHIHRGRAGQGNIYAPVASWILHKGPVPEGMLVCHNCPSGDNPSCVNPNHLWLGTHLDNMDDMVLKRRSTFGERHGRHKLTQAEITEIRKLYKDGARSQTDLGEKFGVTQSNIHCIVKRKSWYR